jgi:hypothetical protein
MVKQYSRGPGTKGFAKKIGEFLNPRAKKEVEEFGPGKRDFIVCPECEAVYYHKSWHHGMEGAVKDQMPEEFADKHGIKFRTCPACQMKKDKVYEGEVIIRVGKSGGVKSDILNAVKNSDKQAQDRDPMDRVLWIDDRGSEVRVYTSENQLAVKIGKKINSAFKGGKLNIKYSGKEDTARVVWERSS